MPKYSVKQINMAWHLVKDHNKNIYQVAEFLDCSEREAFNLIDAAKRMYDRPIDHFLPKNKKQVETIQKIQRPKAEYSNNLYWNK